MANKCVICGKDSGRGRTCGATCRQKLHRQSVTQTVTEGVTPNVTVATPAVRPKKPAKLVRPPLITDSQWNYMLMRAEQDG